MSSYETKKTTHFGYRRVDWDKKVEHVDNVFHSVSDKYDVMNDVMSLGLHRLWKRITVNASAVRAGHTVLDLAGGTGDVTALLARLVGCTGQVVLADINDSMLQVGRNKLTDKGIVDNVSYIQANAESLPFSENVFNCIVIAFGLRNVTDQVNALQSMWRVLKPGGRLLILEFSHVTHPWIKRFYDLYSFSVLPVMGKYIAKDAKSYRYLAESIRMHPNQETLSDMLKTSGFVSARYQNLLFGVVALHQALKP